MNWRFGEMAVDFVGQYSILTLFTYYDLKLWQMNKLVHDALLWELNYQRGNSSTFKLTTNLIVLDYFHLLLLLTLWGFGGFDVLTRLASGRT
jgi:hypothetical protein